MTAYQKELAGWLSTFKADIFATWTFGQAWPRGPSRESVQRHVDRWLAQHDLAPSFAVVERGKSGERRAHAHGIFTSLQRIPPPLQASWRQGLWKDWSRRYGRCTFSPLREHGGAEGYVSKYVTKDLTANEWWVR